MKIKTPKTKKISFALSLISEEIIAEVEHHFEQKSLVPSEDQIDPAVKISKSKGVMEFIIEDDNKKVNITCGPTVISVYKSDFTRELARYTARTVMKK